MSTMVKGSRETKTLRILHEARSRRQPEGWSRYPAPDETEPATQVGAKVVDVPRASRACNPRLNARGG